jgi:peptide/nickel transport system permease protein
MNTADQTPKVLSSPGLFRQIWRHSLGKMGMGILFPFLIMAIGAPFLVSDTSPDAHNIHLHAPFEPPMTLHQLFTPHHVEPGPSLWQRYLSGDPREVSTMVYSNATHRNDSVFLSWIPQHSGAEWVVWKGSLSEFEKGEKRTSYRWLGTDNYGRDVASRIILGSRISLSIGIIAVIISLIIGTIMGLLAGYYGGITDKVIMWFASVLWSLPTVLLVLAISFALGKGYWQMFVAIGLSSWVELCRIVRGEVIAIRNKPYIQAVRLLGVSHRAILMRHLLPNISSSIIVICTANFSSSILLEAGLSFLGLGVKPPTPSWGMMMNDYYGFILLNKAYLSLAPGVAIMFMVIGFNFIGIALRDVLQEDGRQEV